MNELLVKLDFNVDEIFDEDFQSRLNGMIRRTVLDVLEVKVREASIKVYEDSALDVSEAVLTQYKREHAKFEASLKRDNSNG